MTSSIRSSTQSQGLEFDAAIVQTGTTVSTESPKDFYKNLLLRLLDNTSVKSNSDLLSFLKSQTEELMTQRSQQLYPLQEELCSWVENLLIDEKVHTFVAKKLLQIYAPNLPSIAFGAAEWKKYFGHVGAEPSLPSDINAILSTPCPFVPGKKVQDTHILVLVPQTVNGEPLTMELLGELVKKPLQGHATQYKCFALNEYIDPVAPKSHWALLTRDVVEGSRGKMYYNQQVLLKAPYEVPTILDVTVAIFMEHVRTGARLYSDRPWTSTRCQEKYSSYHYLMVGGFSDYGLEIDYGGGARDGNDLSGVGGLRKF